MSIRAPLLLAWLAAACTSAPPYVCQTNAQCVDATGASGICEPDGFCSVADASCSTTSRRYAGGAGDKANACVVATTASCIVDLVGGDQHFCVIRADGTVWCWGINDAGQLGDGTTDDRAVPVKVKTPVGKTFVEVAASENHTCARATDNTLWCWGANDTGQLGVVDTNGNPAADSPVPLQVKGVTGTNPPFTLTPFLAKHVSAGGKHVCAVDDAGALYCWGENSDGQCAQKPPSAGGNADDVFFPTAVPGLDEGVVGVAVGDEQSGCVKDDGTIFEFGGNANGQLGSGGGADSYLPVQARITSATTVVGGDEHMCATKNDGTAWCWGYGAAVGIDGGADKAEPQRILAAKSVFAGGSAFHTCAIQGTDFLCWGQNDQGQVGIDVIDPDHATIPTPTPALLTTVVRSASSTGNTCAVTAEGQLWCWGANDRGQLAQGSIGAASSVPTRVVFDCAGSE